MKSFADLTEREILAIAIASEEEDARIYMAFAEDLDERYPASARTFREMADVEQTHREMLLAQYKRRFGEAYRIGEPPELHAKPRGFVGAAGAFGNV